MKKLLLSLLVCLITTFSIAQAPSYQQKLYYTCKVWGFIKYYHSNVSNCHVNWDSVLVTTLPLVKAAGTNAEFNDALDSMLKVAGTMALASTPLPDTLPAELKRNRNFGWISDPVFRTDVQVALDTIKNNFRPHPICWVKANNYSTGYLSYLEMPADSMELNIDTKTSYPDEFHRLLQLFKYWNIVCYFYPNNYILDKPWDSTLYNFSIPIATVNNAYDLYLLYERISSTLEDAHTEGLSYSSNFSTPPGFYRPDLRLKYIGNKYVVIRSAVSGIVKGDVIISVDGLTTKQWEDSLSQYISAGNDHVLKRTISQIILCNSYGASEKLVIEDSTGTDHNKTVSCTNSPYTDYAFYYGDYYPADSLSTVLWTTLGCNTGYVNMGNLQDSNAAAMYDDLYDKPAIIFDLRPNAPAIASINNLMFPSVFPFANLTIPNLSYPGTFNWEYDSAGITGNPRPYKGKVIILINEETQSHDEFYCMLLETMPGAIKVGSQTAGADGNISFWNLSQDLYTGFSSLGIFYPDGTNTQRRGILPDSVIMPTIAGIRHGDDEVLDKALSIACSLGFNNVPSQRSSIRIYPNPATDKLSIEIDDMQTDKAAIRIFDIAGHLLTQKDIAINAIKTLVNIDVTAFPAGMYLVRVQSDAQVKTMKFTKL